jgi:hypothetical protein
LPRKSDRSNQRPDSNRPSFSRTRRQFFPRTLRPANPGRKTLSSQWPNSGPARTDPETLRINWENESPQSHLYGTL